MKSDQSFLFRLGEKDIVSTSQGSERIFEKRLWLTLLLPDGAMILQKARLLVVSVVSIDAPLVSNRLFLLIATAA